MSAAAKAALSPELISLLLKTKPVFKKRTPLWFFTNEITAKGAPPKPNDGSPESSDEPKRKLKRTEIWDLWNTMRPEAKRRYFNMAEIDEVRYKEQRALWVAEIGSLISKEGANSQRLTKVLENFQLSNQHNPLLEYQKNYDSMIQCESTKTLYRELVDKVEKINLNLNPEALISDIPKNCRPLLKRPRRPMSPFLLYSKDNRDKLAAARMELNPELTHLAFVSKVWSKLDNSERAPYEKRYAELMDEYTKAIDKFKAEISESCDGNNLDQATRERRAFRKNLRKKLREYDIVPVNVRNSFVFFLKENKGIPLVKLTKIWRELPEEEKLKYKILSEQDNDRYYKQKSSFVKIKQSLDSLLAD